jgi:hypothetical protein
MSPFAIETIARVAHEVNRAYCEAIGDASQVPWWEAPDSERDSVREGVRGVLEERYATAEEQHEAWLADKAAEGWSYGPTKDVLTKQDPAFVLWDELPEEHRVKAELCRAVCREVGIAMGVNAEAP